MEEQVATRVDLKEIVEVDQGIKRCLSTFNSSL
jgi:hypothetical protein